MATATIDARINALAKAVAAKIKPLLSITGKGSWEVLYSGSTTTSPITLKKPITDYSLIAFEASASNGVGGIPVVCSRSVIKSEGGTVSSPQMGGGTPGTTLLLNRTTARRLP